MRRFLRRIARLLARCITVALLLPALGGTVRAQEATTARREGVSISLGLAWSELAGAASKGGLFGAGRLDLGYERPFGARFGLRIEGSVSDLRSDLGETGDVFLLPTTVSAVRLGLGVQARRYSDRNAFVGAGITVSADAGCVVDTEGGPGFLGGETVDCTEFTEPALRPRSGVVGAVLTAGVQRGRWEYELRYDQAATPTVDSDAGPLRGRSVAGVVHYRFGSRGGVGRPVQPNDMRPLQAEPSFVHQASISSAGFLLGVAAGAGLGALAANLSGEGDNLDEVGTGILVGAVAGPVAALQWDGRRHGRRASLIATITGSLLGTAVGAVAAYGAGEAAMPIVLIGGPVGATAGYRLTDRVR